MSLLAIASLICIYSFNIVNCANPNYSYHVKIQDPIEANYQEKAETRKGDYTEGFYRLESTFVILYYFNTY